MEDEDGIIQDALGYIYTHVDCPNCGDTIMIEGDAQGDIVTCVSCKLRTEIIEVR